VSDDITVRQLSTHAEYAACVDLQRETWGRDFNDAVPPPILLVSQKLGGVAAGAFDARQRLLGFVFGITGIENGEVVHWSDMLAVHPDARDRGVGRRLKEFQRRAVANVGGRVIYWTFDPLVARNAHLNFNVFGVRAVEYSRDMYGDDTGSDLHRGIGTDRLVVAWPVDERDLALRKREAAAARTAVEYGDARILGDAERGGPATRASRRPELHVRIAVPRDVSIIQNTDVARAARWRASTRAAFETAFAAGFTIDGFTSDRDADRGYYLLTKRSTT
jgi:predicted GNAT superfamily acetyltransferase